MICIDGSETVEEQGGNAVSPAKGLFSADISRWQRHVQRDFLTLCRVPRMRLTWATILIGAVVVEAVPQSDVIEPMLEGFSHKLIGRCKRKLPGMRIRGAFEVDVLHRLQVLDRTHKEAFLASTGIEVAKMTGSQRILLPHLHAVVDMGKHGQERVREQLAAEFPGPWRVLCRPLHTDKTVRENLTALAGYSAKLKVAYSEWHPDRPTRFGPLYEDCWREVIEEIVGGVGLPQMSFRHGGS